MKKLLILALFLFPFILPTQASAQSQRNPCWYVTGSTTHCVPTGTDNPLPVTASVSIGGGFTDAATGTPISVTTGGVTGTLPAGAVVAAFNVGSTNGAYCKLGASATTSDIYLAPNGGWFAFSVGASTQLTCITSTSTTTVNMVGGSGLPTGSGGGAGGSGGGATNITQVGGVNVPTGGGLQSGALPVDESTSSQFHADMTAAVPVNVGSTATAMQGMTQGTALSGNQTAGLVGIAPGNATPTDCSAATSGTPSTATTLLAASQLHRHLDIKVEGATAVCLNRTGGAATIGSAGTFCLKGASVANAGDGGSWSTPATATDVSAISMVSTGTSVLMSCTWQ